VVAVCYDRASGRKEGRAELQRLMGDARRGAFHVVAVAAFNSSLARRLEPKYMSLCESVADKWGLLVGALVIV